MIDPASGEKVDSNQERYQVVVAGTFNPSTPDTEASEFLSLWVVCSTEQVPGQPGLQKTKQSKNTISTSVLHSRVCACTHAHTLTIAHTYTTSLHIHKQQQNRKAGPSSAHLEEHPINKTPEVQLPRVPHSSSEVRSQHAEIKHSGSVLDVQSS